MTFMHFFSRMSVHALDTEALYKQSLPPGLTSSARIGRQNYWHSFVSEHMLTFVMLYKKTEMLALCCISLHPVRFLPAYLILPHPIPSHPIPSHLVSEQSGSCLCRLRLCWDRVLDPAAKHVQLDKRVRGAQANVDLTHLLKPEPGGDEAASSSSDRDSDHQVTMTQKGLPNHTGQQRVTAQGLQLRFPCKTEASHCCQ